MRDGRQATSVQKERKKKKREIKERLAVLKPFQKLGFKMRIS